MVRVHGGEERWGVKAQPEHLQAHLIARAVGPRHVSGGFDAAVSSLSALIGRLDIDSDQVVVAPRNHDIRFTKCGISVSLCTNPVLPHEVVVSLDDEHRSLLDRRFVRSPLPHTTCFSKSAEKFVVHAEYRAHATTRFSRSNAM